MALARKMTKKVYKKKAYTKRSYRQYPKKITNYVHRFIRWNDKDTFFPTEDIAPTLIVALSTAQNLSYSFNLRNVVNAVDFTSLYDQYRINKVTVYLERFWNSTGDTIAGTPYNSNIRVVHDYNDNNVLSQEDDYLEYSNCKSYKSVGNGTIKLVLYPKIAQVIENVGGTQGFNAVASNKMWLNTVDDRIPHFGIKIFVPPGISSTGQALFRVRAKFDLSFKNSK